MEDNDNENATERIETEFHMHTQQANNMKHTEIDFEPCRPEFDNQSRT